MIRKQDWRVCDGYRWFRVPTELPSHAQTLHLQDNGQHGILKACWQPCQQENDFLKICWQDTQEGNTQAQKLFKTGTGSAENSR